MEHLPIHHMIAGGPRPVAPFSHAVEADGWVFITGLAVSALVEIDLVARRP
ncbi:MAG TPA: hypothetical protein VMM60_11530 [Ilumatobacter sp.]|nr:hypothetical protein [Ilumatobacter sp.]